MSHKILYAVSVLPALIIMPTLAETETIAKPAWGASAVWTGLSGQELVGVEQSDNVQYKWNTENNSVTAHINNTESRFGAFSNLFGRNDRKDGDGDHVAVSGLILENSSFESNTGLVGGAMSLWQDGRTPGTDAKDTLWTDNKIPEPFENTIKSTKFINNSANKGGAFATLAQMAFDTMPNYTMTDVVFSGNRAIGTSEDTHNGGGAIYTESVVLDINDASFSENTATTHGGAIFNNGTVNLNNADFVENIAGGVGGAVFNNGEMSITGGEFNGNKSQAYGGAIYNTGEMTLDNVMFRDNVSGDDGGAVLTTMGKLTVTNSLFENNTAMWDGAIGVGKTSQDLVVKNTTFKNNSALSTGAVGVFMGPATLTDVKFIGNTATDAGEEGAGALFLGTNSMTTVDNGQFVANKSASWGGAIATRTADGYDNHAAKLDIMHGVFNGNNAATNGGAIYNAFYKSVADADAVTISDVAFVRNSATNGGAIYNDGTADKAGNHAALHISDSRFINNFATQGGAIYNTTDGKIEFTGTNVFSGNRAGTANDIYNDGTIMVSDGETTFDGGVLGDGAFTLADGASLNLGTGVIAQSQININGVVNADIASVREYGRMFGDVTFGDNALLNLNVATAGTYKIFDTDNDFAGIDAGALFDVTNNGADGVVISAKKTETLAAENGLSDAAASTLVGLANAGGTLAGASIAAQNALALGDIEYIENESAKARPHDVPVVHSVATSVQNQVLALTSARMAGGATGRSGGDFVTTGSGMWAHGLINRSKMNNAFHGDTRGLALGVDMTFNRKYTFGMGYAHGDTDVKSNVFNTDIESNTLFAYAQYKPNKWFVNGAFNYTFADYSTSTDIFGVNITNDYDVKSYGGQVMTGYDFATGVTPMAGVRYLYITQDDYSNGIADVKSDDTNFMTGVAGMKYAFDIDVERVALVLRPELRAAATYDFMSDDNIATVLMPGAPAYIVNGDRLSRMGGEFGIGMTALFGGFELSLNYDLDLHKDYTSQTGMLKLKYSF
ncbi:MAG: autotransporter domain-containing protein [Muribaculaceae bacterium]|nr:autotransporter domain-containing protein [Muribaculaceae bacterium]